MLSSSERKVKSINNVINIFFLQSKREPTALNLCKSQGPQHRIFMKKATISEYAKSKGKFQHGTKPLGCRVSTFKHVTGNKRNSLTTLMFLCSPSKILVSLRQTLKLSLRTSSTHNAKASWGLLRIWWRVVT